MQVGELIERRFLLETRAASGGMGTVFRALDLVENRRVAVKTCAFGRGETESNDRSAAPERARARFELEARALADVRDPAVVGYVAHGVTDAGEPYLVMEWVDGESLAERLVGRGLTLHETLCLARDLVRALRVIHERGIVHRDFKPANVMLRGGDIERAVLVDFGVARRVEATALTLSGARVGTLLYMAPEQIRDARRVDGRADVFALGCVLFECLTGVRPFEAEDALGTIAQILLDEPPDPRRHRPDLPEDVARLLLRLLCRDRAGRPEAGGELEQELAALALRHAGSGLGPPRRAERPIATGAATSPAATVAAESEVAIDRAPLELDRGLVRASGRARCSVHPAHALVGRESELLHLQALLASGAGKLALWGPPGIGKTRLALELAARGVAPLDTIELVPLGQARDIDDAVRIVARATAASLRGGDTPEQGIGRALGRWGPALVILDRVEHLLQELEPLLDGWQRAAPEIRFLITSRERPRHPSAIAIELGPLPVRDPGEPPGSEPSVAASLFLARAREVDPGFGSSGVALPTIEAIVRALEGIPLAIELAAARVRLLGLDGVMARLSRQLELLGRPDAGVAPEPVTMRAAIRASVELLSDAERRAFLQCSVFCGGFTVEAAEAVLDVGEDAPAVLDLLQSLRDKSLLGSQDAPAADEEPRLFLFSVVREYALAELRGEKLEAACRARHAAFYTRRVLALARRPDALAGIEADSDNVIAAIEHALSAKDGDLRLALDALVALEPLIGARGPLPSFMQLLDRAIAAVGAAGEAREDPVVANVRLVRARVLGTAGRFEAAGADLERVLASARASRDARLEGSALLELGVVRHFTRSLEAARECYEAALTLLRARGERELEARCYGNLGALLHDRGSFAEAAAYYFRAIHVLEETGERRMRGNFLNNLGVLEQELGERERAGRRYQQALTLLREAGDPRLLAITLGNLGVLQQECGDFRRARRCHERALALLEPLDDPYSLALCLARLGATLAMLGERDPGEALLLRAQRTFAEGEPSRVEAIRLQRVFVDLALAGEAAAAGDWAESRARLELVRERCERVERAGLTALSDDIRVTLRIVRPMVAALAQRVR